MSNQFSVDRKSQKSCDGIQYDRGENLFAKTNSSISSNCVPQNHENSRYWIMNAFPHSRQAGFCFCYIKCLQSSEHSTLDHQVRNGNAHISLTSSAAGRKTLTGFEYKKASGFTKVLAKEADKAA
eukprot:Sdes_comp18490_c0_seq1m8492